MEKLIMVTMMTGVLAISAITLKEISQTHEVVTRMVASIVVVK